MTFDGIEISDNSEQPQNELSSIRVTEFGIFICFNKQQPSKNDFSIDYMLQSIEIS